MSVLCYHAVDPAWSSPLAVTPNEFESHARWLSRHRTVVPLAEAHRRMDARGRLPRGTVALTFDDGFAQLNDHVFPTLTRLGLPATVFVVAATLTERGHAVDWVDTPPPWRLRTMTADDVLHARDLGVEIASHSWSHRTLTSLDEDECREDLSRSRLLLEDLLGSSVQALAYPRGRHDPRVRRSAAAAGYTVSYALPESAEQVGPHALPRVGVFPGNGTTTLRAKTSPSYLGLRHSRVFPALRRVVRR